MIVPDINLLVYAYNDGAPDHGFRHRRPGNRLKSESFEWTSAWYSIASAAIWASVTRFAPSP